jgi:hypothetical protein
VVQDALDGLWKAHQGVVSGEPYPQARMDNFLSVIASAFVVFMQKQLSARSLWTGPFVEVRSALRDAVRVCEKWVSTATELCSTFWSTSADAHRWKGAPHTDVVVVEFGKRLDEVRACVCVCVLGWRRPRMLGADSSYPHHARGAVELAYARSSHTAAYWRRFQAV